MKTKAENQIEPVQNPCKHSPPTVFLAPWRCRAWRLGGWGGAVVALLLLTPAAFAATLYLDLSSTPGSFFDGSTTTGDLSTTLTWTLDATGQTSPGLYVLADNIQIGVSPSDFSGDNITVNMSTANNIGASPGAFTIVSTNVIVTMSGSANCRFGNAFSWTVPTGSTLIVTTTANNNGWNFNSKACTFLGGGIIQFNDAFCANGNALDSVNMPGGTIILNQAKTSNFGGAAGAAFVLTAGTIQFASATALTDAFGDWIFNNVFTINGGTIDNTSGAAGAIAIGNGAYKFGGNWTFPGSASLSLGATNTVTLTNNVVITNLANTLTMGGVSGTGFGLTATGPGALVISGNSPFTGPMIVNSGALILTNNANFPSSSAIQFSNTSTFDLSGITGQLTNPNTLALTNTTLVLAVPLAPTTNVVVGALVLGGTSNTIKISSLPVITSYPATFTLINYSNTLARTNLVLAPLPTSPNTPFAGYLASSNANLIQLVITNGPPPARSLLWAGKDNSDNGPTAWDVQTSFNWTTNTANPATFFFPGDFVLFNDTSASSPSPGQVNLVTTLTPSTMTVSNNTLNYILSGTGNLADPLTGPLQLIKQGTGTLTMDNAQQNTYTGGTLISAGTFQIGNNDGRGSLGAGPVTDNATLVFDGSYTVPNAISGTGSILLYGNGILNLSGANTFKGGITATNGVLQAGSSLAFGTNKITINSGAVLDLNGQSLGATPVFVQGAGSIPSGGGQGAIDNSGTTVPGDLGLEFVTLTGNTTLSTTGGPSAGRWDLRSPGGDSGVVGTAAASPSTAWLSTGSNAYNLTLEGSGFLGLVSAWVDPKLANIDILAGTFDYEGGTSGLGNPTNTLTVESSAIFELWNASNALNKIIVLNSGATVLNGSGAANSILGPVILTNAGSLCAFQVASGTTLNLKGPVSGQGELEMTAAGTLILNGGNSFTGGIQQNLGTIIVNGDNSLLTGSNFINGGTFTLNGILGGATTNTLAALSGTGTNLGAVDVSGTFTPGGAGAAGTFTVGSTAAPSSLTLESSATVTVDLSANNALGGGTNDLIVVNGNLSLSGTLVVNALGILTTGVPYTVITYTGNLSTPNGALSPPAPVNGYNFTLDTSVKGQVNIKVVPGSGPPVWNGGAGPGNTGWSQAANWAGIPISGGLPLFFAGSTSLNNTNDTPVDSTYGNITFVPGAGPFVLNGNNLQMGSGMFINNSSNPQTIDLGLDFSSSFAVSGGSSAAAPLIIGGGLNDAGNATAIYFNGFGTLSNNLNVVGVAGASGTNAIEMTNSSANWTLVDSPASTPSAPITNTLPWGFEIFAGTFNFGSTNSAPNIISTPANAGINGSDNQVGDLANQTGTFNMVNGTLSSTGRFNTALVANATGIINMSGGTWNLGGQFQGANGSNPGEVSILNVSGGTLNVGTAATPTSQIYVASRGGGTLTISGSAAVNCGTLDVSRNADGNAIGGTGTVNLNGGTLKVNLVGTATANSQPGPATTGPNPTAAFNFNGGTLLAGASSTVFFQGSPVAPIIPITTTVKAGGALVNDGGFAISMLEILAHDSTLGATPDGGFLKLGAGTNTLTRVNTYTGPTIVSNGALVIASGGSLAAGSTVTIASGATLNVVGAVNGLVTNNGFISGAGTFGTNVIITSTGTNTGTGNIAGGVTNGGLLSPGAFGSISNLTVTNNITDLAGSTTALTLNRGAATSNSALSSIKGTITYAGTLMVTNIGSTLVGGDSFQLFKATNYAGAFASIVPATPGAGLTWNTSNLAVTGTLSVSAGAPAGVTIGNIAVSGASFTISGSGGAALGTWKVLSSTNVTFSLTNWVQVGSGSFDTNGHFTFNGSINPAESQRYYILHSP